VHVLSVFATLTTSYVDRLEGELGHLVGPRGVVARHFDPPLVRGQGPHHHVEVARCWSILPVLSYASFGRFPFLCDILKKDLEVYHRSACRVISGCLAFTPVPLLLLESLTPSY